MSIGRNDQCFCGSGIKYKKCCINLPNEEQSAKYEAMENPQLTQHFFDLQPFKQVSPPALVWGMLTLPATMEKVNRLSQQRGSGKPEADLIKSLNDAEKLVGMLNGQTDQANHKLLLEELINRKEEVTPLVLDRLEKDDNEAFAELAVRYLNDADNVDWDRVSKLAETSPNKYKRSLLSLLLGVKGPEDKLPLVWNQYRKLKREAQNVKDEEQGPLYGLMEYGYRVGSLTS